MMLGIGDKAMVAPWPSHLGLPELHEEMRGQKGSLSFGELKVCESLTGLLSEAFQGCPTHTCFCHTNFSVNRCLVSTSYAQVLYSEQDVKVPFIEGRTHLWGKTENDHTHTVLHRIWM